MHRFTRSRISRTSPQLAALSALAGAALLALTACGGGSSSDDADDTTATLSGTVAVDGLVKGTVVCLDLNANAVCDSGEPASTATGSDGAYKISQDTTVITAAQVAAAPLIAPQIRGVSIDSADGLSTANDADYVLRQVPGRAGQINPLTTLVAAGVAKGMSETTARTNAADQLGIAVAKIDNYQDDPAFNAQQVTDNARLMAKVTAMVLESGTPLAVADPSQASAAQQGDLRSLNFTDTSNWRVTDFVYQARAAGDASLLLTDQRAERSAGTALDSATLYNQAYLTATGWRRCDATQPIRAKLGTPARSTFCDARHAIVARASTDIGARTMAALVTDLQSDSRNLFNVGGSNTALLAALGSAAFPAGSATSAGTSLTLNQPVFIDRLNADGVSQAVATTLEQLIDARPASGVNLSTAAGSLSLGLSSSSSRNLRVAFTGTTSATAGTVQYYDCELNANLASNCTATQTGTYEITAVNGARVMRFAGHPTTFTNNLQGYAEVKASNQANAVTSGDWVYRVRWLKPDTESNTTRNIQLNGTAWTAMKTQLGL